jgi:hypothetical protein
MTKPRMLQIRIDLDSPALAKAGEPSPELVGAALIRLADRFMLRGLCPGGVWGGDAMLDGRNVGYWTVHVDKDPD